MHVSENEAPHDHSLIIYTHVHSTCVYIVHVGVCAHVLSVPQTYLQTKSSSLIKRNAKQ